MQRILCTALALLIGAPALAAGNDRQVVLLGSSAKGFTRTVEALGGTVSYHHAATGVAFVDGLDEAAAASLASINGVLDMAADVNFEIDAQVDLDTTIEGDSVIASPSDPATAFFFPRQWHLQAIEADAAWAAGRVGSPDVTIAILDTGIDYEYPDLNGRVDLSRSASFVPIDDFYVSLYFPSRHPVTDLNFHGTHVAATAASNAIITAGVTSQTTLIGVKVCNVLGGCSTSSVIAGLLHAADEGADVANLSLGGGFTKAGNGRFLGFINQVFSYANRKGMTVVVAAGNSQSDMDHDGNHFNAYCSAPNAICVSATGPTGAASVNGPWFEVDAFAGYSNYGRSAVDVAAPGGNTGGLIWAPCSQTSLLAPICASGYYIIGTGGTSMAAPHVAGLAALVVEDVGRKPGLVKARILQGADDLGEPGTDPYYGKGRINVFETIR